MCMTTVHPARTRGVANGELRFVHHASFEEPDAEQILGEAPADQHINAASFMPDDETRLNCKRMHYAAWRANKSVTSREARCWRRLYYSWRNRIVLGNVKLTYRAVQKWGALSPIADDMVGECHIVLIKAVAGFNPWLSIRFSTYAFTCLMRALSRLSQRQSAARRSSIPLELLPESEVSFEIEQEPSTPNISRLDDYLKEENPLLSAREKLVLSRRYHLNGEAGPTETLAQLGHDLGLSKERVRQVQMSALGKLRNALLSNPTLS